MTVERSARRLAGLLLALEVFTLLLRFAAVAVAIEGVVSGNTARVAFAIFIWIVVDDNGRPGIFDYAVSRTVRKEASGG